MPNASVGTLIYKVEVLRVEVPFDQVRRSPARSRVIELRPIAIPHAVWLHRLLRCFPVNRRISSEIHSARLSAYRQKQADDFILTLSRTSPLSVI
jgi:hypothetical protein